jgi:SAM-dependent methyltransferase
MIENYTIDAFGVIHQIDFTPITYDRKYLSYYEAKSDRTIKLGYQRLGWLLGLLQHMPRSVLEIGYGTGTFIEAAQTTGVPRCAGCDVSPFPLPAGVPFLDWGLALDEKWEVVAMFDVLEHVPDLTFLGRLQTDYLALAVPYCRWRELGDAWFRDWRMLLPNEHLHHFDPQSLEALLGHYGFAPVTLNTFEDGIRLRPSETGPNILSGLFRKKAG